MLRLKRICSSDLDFHENCETLINNFKKRGYPTDLLNNCRSQVENLNRKDLLLQTTTPKKEKEVKDFYLITPYYPNSNIAARTVKKNWQLLSTSSTTQHLFEKKLVVGH